MLLELYDERIRGRVSGGEHDEGLDDLAAKRVGLADDGGLGDGRVLDERGLDLEGADAVGRAVDDVVGAPECRQKKVTGRLRDRKILRAIARRNFPVRNLPKFWPYEKWQREPPEKS